MNMSFPFWCIVLPPCYNSAYIRVLSHLQLLLQKWIKVCGLQKKKTDTAGCSNFSTHKKNATV